ncbi:hypothetical protein E2562_035615 [Oryza meyeriana var. granulata]|uniref:MATH domain-containing protein n=1 Tax=Oryza meyeriana var. granulata TaxID=110450 RepID=A0A6G1CBC9_9ORYZ|nr:hypothetical protein E2562_035615 [Oryza meyeriana var. granulata]
MAMAAGRILRTASAIVSKPSTGSHVLRIDGYSHLIGVARHGEYVDSCEFDAGGHTWRLLLYPNGSNQKYSSHIGVFLQLASYPGVSGHVHARPWFSLLDRARRPAPSRDAGVHSFRHGHCQPAARTEKRNTVASPKKLREERNKQRKQSKEQSFFKALEKENLCCNVAFRRSFSYVWTRRERSMSLPKKS